MSVRITEFTIEAYEAALALWQECEGIGLSEADSKERIQSHLERNPGMSFVALDRDTLVGAVLCGHDGRRGTIHHLAVHPSWRRQGIARQLADKCLEVLRAAGIDKCHGFVFDRNAEGIEFWRNAGWTLRDDVRVVSKTLGPIRADTRS